MKNKLIFIAIILFFTFSSHSQCFEIESILVDACGSPEGENEMVRFKVGNADLCTNDLSVTWPNSNNAWLGLTQNAVTAQITADLNATIVSCGYLLEPTSCVLPANSTVLLITSTAIDVTANSFANLGDTLYVIYQTAGNTSGHFANYISTGGLRTITMSFSNPAGCTDQVTYDRGDLVNINGTTGGTTAQKNGSTVVFDPAGNPTYINNGCQAPVDPFIVNMTASEVNSGTQTICPGDVIVTNVNITGNYQEIIWSGGEGTFDNQDVITTNYNSSVNDTLDFYLYTSVVNMCNDTILDSVLITINSSPFLTQIGPFTTFSGTQQVPSTMTGGTWTSNCGTCLSPTGVFDPAVSGEGTFQICHQAGCGQDCINIVVDNSCTMSLTVTANDPLCFNQNNGGFVVTANSPVGNVTFTSTDQNNVTITNNSGIFNDLVSGTYYISVTDDLCTLLDTVILNNPPEIEAFYTINDITCHGINDGSIKVDSVHFATGNAHYVWTITTTPPITPGDTNFVNGLPPGTFTLTVQDETAPTPCQVTYTDLIIQDAEPIIIKDYVVTKNPLCRTSGNQDAHGQISVAVSGGLTSSGTGTDFLTNSYWQNNATGATWNQFVYPGIPAGSYTFFAVNELGCVKDSTFYLDSISPIANFTTVSPQFTSNYVGTAVVEVTFTNTSQFYDFANNINYNGNDPNSNVDTLFTWYFTDANNQTETLHTESLNPIVKDYLTEGLYTVCLEVKENLNHCIDTACVQIQIYDPASLTAPNVFTPDGDGTNDDFYFPSSALISLTCKIYDRWGNMVFEMNAPTDKWNGINYKNNKNCTDGVYFYVYEAESSNATKFKGQGTIQLIRNK